MSRYRITVIRRGRRQNDADAEARFQRYVGDLCGLGDETVPFLPPSRQCGWMQAGQVAGGATYCLDCSPQPPTPGHVPVYHQSYFATKCCVVCGRRLDHAIA